MYQDWVKQHGWKIKNFKRINPIVCLESSEWYSAELYRPKRGWQTRVYVLKSNNWFVYDNERYIHHDPSGFNYARGFREYQRMLRKYRSFIRFDEQYLNIFRGTILLKAQGFITKDISTYVRYLSLAGGLEANKHIRIPRKLKAPDYYQLDNQPWDWRAIPYSLSIVIDF
jgi:hypothetical protein